MAKELEMLSTYEYFERRIINMESENLYSLIEKYKLSEEEHRVILEKLKEDMFSTKTQQVILLLCLL